MKPKTKTVILFFDGVCNLCNASVDFFIGNRFEGKLAPLQGPTALEKLGQSRIQALSSVVLWVDLGTGAVPIVYEKSDAVLKALTLLGGVYALAQVFWMVPRFIRDFIYDWVANHRYQWFGKKNTCRLPTPEEKSIFLP